MARMRLSEPLKLQNTSSVAVCFTPKADVQMLVLSILEMAATDPKRIVAGCAFFSHERMV